MNYERPYVVAEIGCNHRGEMETAEEMIKTAAYFCKADFVKFQKRNPKELLDAEQYQSPHPNPIHAYGKTYGEHREFLEFDIDQHRHLFSVCKKHGIEYSCSAWDLTSAKEIVSLKPQLIKIPSASNTHIEMLEYLCKHFEGDVHLSLGMTTNAEKSSVFDLFEKHGRLKSLVVYHTTSGYPVPFEDLNLLEIKNLTRDYKDKVKAIGYSGHHQGISCDIIAYTLGAQWIERHFTLDRTWRGTDHSASLEPDGLRRVVRDVRNAQKTLTYKTGEIVGIEVENRKKLKWVNR